MLKSKLFRGLIILALVILLPYVITIFLSGKRTTIEKPIESDYKIIIQTSEGQNQEIDLEEYIIGVVAAEMPANFELEALKAQAVAARTYTVKHYESNGQLNRDENFGQSYISKERMEEIWGVNSFVQNYNKISSAVRSTEGLVIVYENEPIEAVFHSTSGGMTRAASDVWEMDLPYLVAVDSSNDIKAPSYLQITKLSNEEIVRRIREHVPDFEVFTGNVLESTQIISRSESGYISSIQIGNKIFKGEEIRNYLGLNSSNFTIEDYDGEVRFTSKGYGHGVGLSQYGAHYMAQQGYSYEEILKYYYANIEIVKMENIE